MNFLRRMMRRIEQSSIFKRQKKRIDRSGGYRSVMETRFKRAVLTLANDMELDYSYHDHDLHGNWEGYRECHLAFDLLLVYRYEDNSLILERLGSHSEVLGL